MERAGGRWLFEGNGEVVVGDAVRDLMSVAGGMTRHPAPHGFRQYWCMGLLRQTGTDVPGVRSILRDGPALETRRSTAGPPLALN